MPHQTGQNRVSLKFGIIWSILLEFCYAPPLIADLIMASSFEHFQQIGLRYGHSTVTITNLLEGNMTTTDYAIILGPTLGALIGVGVSHWLTLSSERRRESSNKEREAREKKLEVFRTLMATRASTTDWNHVIALNRIDLEFYGDDPSDSDVTESWKMYHSHLKSPQNNWNPDQWDRWEERRGQLFLELLHLMARSLGYNFDRSHLQGSGYSPNIHGLIDNQNAAIRRGVLEVLAGERSVPIHAPSPPSNNTSMNEST